MGNIAERVAEAKRLHKKIDYVSLKFEDGGVFSSLYLNDLPNADPAAVRKLELYPGLAFLAEKDRLLFYTSQESEKVEYSYEYKPKTLSEEELESFASEWSPATRDLIKYFAEERVIDGKKSGGIWFFGLEKEKNGANVRKIYFRCAAEDAESGEVVYPNEEFRRLIEDSGQATLQEILRETFPFTQAGVDLYMVSWNECVESGDVKYKLYYVGRARAAIDPRFFLEALGIPITAQAEEALAEVGELECQGFTVASGSKRSVNLYFKGE